MYHDAGSEDLLFQSLTQKQRECLDRVLMRMTSKEIARELGISPVSVDQRILHARLKMGCPTRDDAVRLYARLLQTYDPTRYDALYLPSARYLQAQPQSEVEANVDVVLREPSMSFADFQQMAVPSTSIVEVPWLDLNLASKVAVIVALAIALVTFLLVVLATADQLSNFI